MTGEAVTERGWVDRGPRPGKGPCFPSALQPSFPTALQKLTVDLTGVQGVLQSQQSNLQQREHSATSSRLYDLYWQAMKILGVQ